MKNIASHHVARRRHFLVAGLLVLSVVSSPACHLCKSKKYWLPPEPAKPAHHAFTVDSNSGICFKCDLPADGSLPAHRLIESTEEAYATAASIHDPQQAVDAYYAALVQSWQFINRYRSHTEFDTAICRAWDIYHSSLAKLISIGQTSGRLNTQNGLLVRTPMGMECIPIQMNEFVWPKESFNELIPVGSYHDKKLFHQYRNCGLGVPLVVVRKNHDYLGSYNPYLLQRAPFAATAILYPNLQPWQNGPLIAQRVKSNGARLVLYNPLQVTSVQHGKDSYQLAADVTAPLGFLGQQSDWNPFDEFARPETDPSLAGLRMLEPYQPGKIPVLFIHGLFSDPQTYLAMANQIRSCPELNARYQIWVFRYPTGGPFLLSAASLRQQLESLITECRTRGCDESLEKMVVVGHSLGGLVTKLQVTDSGPMLWDSISRLPLDQIVAGPQERHRLQEQFYFCASPYIKKAIFIATPNEGSPWAQRPLGKIASKVVKYSPEQIALHDQLIQQNPDVFSPTIARHIPTSIDLLNPDNPILQTIHNLPISARVQSYAIIGTGGSCLARMGPSDGVIPTSSALVQSARETFYVDAVHTTILHNEETIHIVSQILRAHANESVPNQTIQIKDSYSVVGEENVILPGLAQ